MKHYENWNVVEIEPLQQKINTHFPTLHKFPHFPSHSRIRRVPAAVVKSRRKSFLFTFFVAFPSVFKKRGKVCKKSAKFCVKICVFFNFSECIFTIKRHLQLFHEKNQSQANEREETVFHLTSKQEHFLLKKNHRKFLRTSCDCSRRHLNLSFLRGS